MSLTHARCKRQKPLSVGVLRLGQDDFDVFSRYSILEQGGAANE